MTTQATATPRDTARIAWIDVCKGLCMIGIVLSHNEPLMSAYPLLDNLLFSCLVPLFFFTSGLTLDAASPRPQALERAASLLGSFVVLSAIVLPYTLMTKPSARLVDVVAGVAYGSGHTMTLVPFWFITCLVVSLVLHHLLLLLLRRIGVAPSRPLLAGLGLALALGGGFGLAGAHYQLQPTLAWGSALTSGWAWGLDLAPLALGFVLLGQATSARAIQEWIGRLRWQAAGLMLLQLGASVWVLSNFSIHVDMNMRVFHPPLAAFAMALWGGAAVVIAAALLALAPPASRVFITIGQASLTILWLHNALQNSIAERLFAGVAPSRPVFGLMAFAFALLVPLLFDRLVLRRIAPLSRVVFPRFRLAGAAR